LLLWSVDSSVIVSTNYVFSTGLIYKAKYVFINGIVAYTFERLRFSGSHYFHP